MKNKIGTLFVLAAMAVQVDAAYNWELYDDFSGGSLDAGKWTMEVENSSAYPRVESGRLNCSATLNDGSCKVGLQAGDVVGVKADLTVGSAVDNSGNEIEIGLSNGGVLWLDMGLYGSIQYIAASVNDEADEELAFNVLSNMVYNQSYELAVVITNGVVSCYVDEILLLQYDGGPDLEGTYCSIGTWSDALGAVVEGYVDNVYVLREAWDLSSVISELELFAGYDLGVSEYRIEFDLEVVEDSVDEIASVHVTAPFGSFSCTNDWDYWEYITSSPMAEAIPEVDGDWTVTLTHTNGAVATTVLEFKQLDGSEIPDVTTCPQLIVPDLTGSDPIFAMKDVIWEWDSAFDTNATVVALGSWNELTDSDNELFFEPTPEMRTAGPLSLEAGTSEAFFANGFLLEKTNADGVDYTVVKVAMYNFAPTVVDPEWDIDQDHLSNEWELEHFGSLTAADPDGDDDGDGVNNLAEFRAGTDPTDASSLFMIYGGITNNEMTINWMPVEGIEYSVWLSTNLLHGFMEAVSGLNYPQNTFSAMLEEGIPVGFCTLRADRVITNPAVVRQAEVQLDGSVDDWSELPVQFEDPAGDSSIYSGLDITGITVARGTSNLFVKVDRAGLDMPSDASCGLWVYLRSEVGDARDYGINYFYDGRYAYSGASLYDITDEWTVIDESWDGSIRFDDSSSSIEFSIPLNELELFDHYAVDCYSSHDVGGQWWLDNGESWSNNTPSVIILP